jgi:hypothetical protein
VGGILLVLACALVMFGAGVEVYAQAVPPDFAISLESAARMPGRTPPDVQTVQISTNGQAVLSEVNRGSSSLPATTITLPRGAVGRIYKAVVDQRFFDLKDRYRDEDVTGGDRATMTVRAGGRTRTVDTVNIRVGAFDAIARAINDELPAERRIRYNALTVDSYKSVTGRESYGRTAPAVLLFRQLAFCCCDLVVERRRAGAEHGNQGWRLRLHHPRSTRALRSQCHARAGCALEAEHRGEMERTHGRDGPQNLRRRRAEGLPFAQERKR